jgi:hypothetical protein
VNAKWYIIVVAAAVVACGAALADTDPGDEAKEAAAEKQGEALKVERAAELEQMREFENVSPTLAVAVKSCVLAPVPAAKDKGEEGKGVTVGGSEWAGLAWSFARAVGREMAESREGVPPDMAKAGGAKVLVYVDVTVKNLSDRTQLVLPGDFTLQTPQGYAASFNVKTYATADPFDAIYLPPGATSGGKLAFVLPPADEFTLHYYNPATKAAGTKRVLLMRGD